MSKQPHTAKSGSSKAVSGRRHDAKGEDGRGRRRSLAVWIGLGILVLAAAVLLLVRARQPLPTEITPAQAYEKYRDGAFFLDVRTPAEYAQEHIANSVLIPLDELPSRLSEVPRDRDVVVVCRSGARSKEGSAILRQAGYTRVTCLTGGIQAWVEAGYAVER
jgi:rhodanese-related sulfurtransferase